jgi:hypothetical protein
VEAESYPAKRRRVIKRPDQGGETLIELSRCDYVSHNMILLEIDADACSYFERKSIEKRVSSRTPLVRNLCDEYQRIHASTGAIAIETEIRIRLPAALVRTVSIGHPPL